MPTQLSLIIQVSDFFRSRLSGIAFQLTAKDGEEAGIAIILDLFDIFENLHVLSGDLELNFAICLHVSGVACLRQRDHTELQIVADAELRDGYAILLGHSRNLRILKGFTVRYGAVCLHDDALVLAVLDQFKGSVGDVAEDLVDHGLFYYVHSPDSLVCYPSSAVLSVSESHYFQIPDPQMALYLSVFPTWQNRTRRYVGTSWHSYLSDILPIELPHHKPIQTEDLSDIYSAMDSEMQFC